MKYNKPQEVIAEERLRRLVASGTPLPPFLQKKLDQEKRDKLDQESIHIQDNIS